MVAYLYIPIICFLLLSKVEEWLPDGFCARFSCLLWFWRPLPRKDFNQRQCWCQWRFRLSHFLLKTGGKDTKICDALLNRGSSLHTWGVPSLLGATSATCKSSDWLVRYLACQSSRELPMARCHMRFRDRTCNIKWWDCIEFFQTELSRLALFYITVFWQ